MAGRTVPIAETGQVVAQNVQAARNAQGMTQEDLAERLEELGRPIAVPGIRSIENARRRVDVDDLTALAVALRTSPAALLTPRNDAPLTGVTHANGVALKDWVAGGTSLIVDEVVEHLRFEQMEEMMRIDDLSGTLESITLRIRELDDRLFELQKPGFNTASLLASVGTHEEIERCQAEREAAVSKRGHVKVELDRHQMRLMEIQARLNDLQSH